MFKKPLKRKGFFMDSFPIFRHSIRYSPCHCQCETRTTKHESSLVEWTEVYFVCAVTHQLECLFVLESTSAILTPQLSYVSYGHPLGNCYRNLVVNQNLLVNQILAINRIPAVNLNPAVKFCRAGIYRIQ